MVRDQWGCSCWMGLGLGHSNVVDDLLDEAWLSHFDDLALSLDVKTQEGKHVTFILSGEQVSLAFESLDVVVNKLLVGTHVDAIVHIGQDHDWVSAMDE